MPETSITKVMHEDGIDPNFSMVAAVRTSAVTLMRLAYLITPYQRNDEELARVSGSFESTAYTFYRSRPFEKGCGDA